MLRDFRGVIALEIEYPFEGDCVMERGLDMGAGVSDREAFEFSIEIFRVNSLLSFRGLSPYSLETNGFHTLFPLLELEKKDSFSNNYLLRSFLSKSGIIPALTCNILRKSMPFLGNF